MNHFRLALILQGMDLERFASYLNLLSGLTKIFINVVINSILK